MSSGISTEPGRLKPAPTVASHVEAGFSRPDSGFQVWHFFALASILLATVAVVLTRRSTPEHLILVSFTIAAAGAVAAAFYRMLAPLVFGAQATGDTVLTERRRAALERDKMLTVRAIKELEFDRAMGKLSADDFQEMSGRLRQRALTLMKQLDEPTPYRQIIEKDLEQRLEGRLKPAPADVPELREPEIGTDRLQRASPDVAELREPVIGRGRLQPACKCGTVNDADALFCKQCGTRLQTG